MAGRARYAVQTLAATLAASVALVSVAAAQAPATDDDGRFTDFRLRTLDNGEGSASDQGLEDPFDPDLADPGGGIEAAPPAVEDEPEIAAPPPSTFDLFEGPRSAPSQRQNLPRLSPAAPAAAAVNAPRAGQRETTTAPPPEPFRASGPVRSPTFSPANAEERVNRAVGELRSSFPAIEDDPFAADGIRVGRFVLYPVLEQSVGVSDNLDDDPNESSGAFSETRLSTRFVSDWARHQAEINANATYRRNFGGDVEEDPSLGLDALLRLDFDPDFTGTLRGALSFAREDPILADPLLPPSDRPDVLAYSFGGELQRDVGRTAFTLNGDVVREEQRVDGLPEDISGVDDFTTASLGLRAGYEIAPAFQPFVGASVGKRFFDELPAGGGAERDSIISALRGGVLFDFGEKLSGEVALGYAWNAPEEGSLETLGAPTLDMTLNWSPRRGTDVLLTAATFFDPDSSNLSTSTVYETALGIRHRATARTDLTGRLTAALRDREGPSAADDTTYAAEAGLTYWLNRGIALTGLLRHERLESEFSEAEYSANSVRVGIRLQR